MDSGKLGSWCRNGIAWDDRAYFSPTLGIWGVGDHMGQKQRLNGYYTLG